MQAREDLFFQNFETHQAQNEEEGGGGGGEGMEGGMGMPGMNGMMNPMAMMSMQQVLNFPLLIEITLPEFALWHTGSKDCCRQVVCGGSVAAHCEDRVIVLVSVLFML